MFDEAIAYVISYKNSDYAPVLVENRFITYEENLKTIEIKCIFEVNNNLVSNIGKIKKKLRNATIQHNGLEYDVILESISDLDIGDTNFTEVNFICKGNVYKPTQSQFILGIGSIKTGGVGLTPLSFKITNATGTISIKINNMASSNNDLVFNNLTPSQTVIVDGVKGTVTGINNKNWHFWEFPKIEDRFGYQVYGTGTVEVSWRCKV